MLLDSRGHLKLTDLGLCKKVGDVSRMDEPEQILEMMRRQTLQEQPGGSGASDAVKASPTQTTNKHRSSDDAMAMSFDDMPASMKRDAKTRREVRFVVWRSNVFLHETGDFVIIYLLLGPFSQNRPNISL